MKVWVVLRDDGNSQEAEESIESVWLTAKKAAARSREIGDAVRVRVEVHKVRVAR